MMSVKKPGPLLIYVDVTNLMLQPFITGIQRVVREWTKYVIQNQDVWGCRLRLLRWDDGKSAYQVLDNGQYLHWQNHREVCCDSGQVLLPEQIRKGSVFFDLDSVWPNRPPRTFLHRMLKYRGVKIAVFLHDIISITHPQFYVSIGITDSFLKYLDAELAYADLILTSSQFVVDEVKRLFQGTGRRLPQFAVTPLGSDFVVCRKSDPKIDSEAKRIAKAAPYLLTVATIEPRKNHKVILDCFDQYLEHTNVNIIFAGRKGWDTDVVQARLYQHPQFGIRIFHLEGKSNETISYLYQKAMYTVFPTYVEGFGLPAVESLIAGTPPLLSDIPVMREVAGEYAQYFNPDLPKELAELVLAGLSAPQTYQKWKKSLSAYQPTTWSDFGKNIMTELAAL